LVIDNLRQYFIHELQLAGIRSVNGTLPLLHPVGYYTLNNIPEGDKLKATEYSTKRTATTAPKPQSKTNKSATVSTGAGTSYAAIEPLLVKNTCTACHQVSKRQVGPAFKDIAKRNYSNERIVQLIYNPEPKNWPEHETPMAPMPQVQKDEALKIATWINSLKEAKP
jgi:cytochrome c551/c552